MLRYPLGNGALDAHLAGVRRVLHAWGAGDDVCDAGLFHSIYGTEGFQAREWYKSVQFVLPDSGFRV
jgi:hypothetical protein